MRLDKKTEEKYSKRMRYAERKAEIRKLEQQIKEIDKSSKPKRKRTPSSKKYMILMLTIAIEIVFFIEYVTLRTGDTSCLYVLASIPVTTLVPSLMSYFKKSRIENSSGGIVYDMAMNQTQDNEEVINDEDADTHGIG